MGKRKREGADVEKKTHFARYPIDPTDRSRRNRKFRSHSGAVQSFPNLAIRLSFADSTAKLVGPRRGKRRVCRHEITTTHGYSNCDPRQISNSHARNTNTSGERQFLLFGHTFSLSLFLDSRDIYVKENISLIVSSHEQTHWTQSAFLSGSQKKKSV